jgi:transcriptional regulator with XRE-family HTH domain
MPVYERIKEVRHTLGLSQVKFAKAIYLSNGYLAEIELGNRPVNERLIQLISTIFDVSKQWLLTGEGSMFKTSSAEKLKKITSLFAELKPEFQDFVLKQIDQLIDLQNATQEKQN